jgi:hypothetical protein
LRGGSRLKLPLSAGPEVTRGECDRPSCSVSYLRHNDEASDGSPNGPALRPIFGLARGVAPPCALGSSQSRPQRGVGRARGAAPPCVPGSSENRQRRGVGSRFLRFLVILILMSRPRHRLDQAGVIASHVTDMHAHWPAEHVRTGHCAGGRWIRTSSSAREGLEF